MANLNWRRTTSIKVVVWPQNLQSIKLCLFLREHHSSFSQKTISKENQKAEFVLFGISFNSVCRVYVPRHGGKFDIFYKTKQPIPINKSFCDMGIWQLPPFIFGKNPFIGAVIMTICGHGAMTITNLLILSVQFISSRRINWKLSYAKHL